MCASCRARDFSIQRCMYGEKGPWGVGYAEGEESMEKKSTHRGKGGDEK